MRRARSISIIRLVTGVFQVDVDLGIGGDETGEVRRQRVQADAVDGGDADGADDFALPLAQPGFQRLDALEDRVRLLVECLAGLGRHSAHLASPPLQQHAPIVPLQRSHPLAYRRLGKIAGGGRRREGASLDDPAEELQGHEVRRRRGREYVAPRIRGIGSLHY